ncbi:hypothetical protein RJ640_020191 [Escallonia rubra]|uniref:NB-ARC domain-containing protein n=1 Tax=Escallonia rubra TaxID=112253 RepID=A0AA88R2S6_9ASTE|nr:hypothetical protein RJ640_020191 [Escallonia rubra]
MAHKIKAINLSLDAIYKEATKIGLKTVDQINSSAGTGHQQVPVTHPGVGDSEKIVGREADVSMVADMLLTPNNENGLPVISIVGMPGQGKTTLAKLICKNDKVFRHFDEFIWISVSDDFEDKRILNEMVQSLTQTNPQLSNMGGILKELRKHLNGKKYLVVLDDVWNEIPEKWESLRDALLEIGGSSESKVLVTTRSSKVASTMTSLTYPLKHLSDDDSWIMFKPKAFANGGAVETSDLVEIGREIVKKCRGVPLAIKVVGGLMYSKKSRHDWLSVQDRHLGELPEDVTGVILRILNRDKGCQIEDLGSVNNLKGELKVFGLEDVRTTEAAKKANLLKKSRINALQFHWSGGEEKNTNEVVPEEKNTHEHVLEGLTPHSNLKRLRVQNFRGKNFSSWMMMPSQSSVVLQNLVDIKLIYCQSSEQIPTLGHLTCLKFIYIGGLHNLKRIGAEFYGHIAEVATGSGSGISAGGAMFPALRNLRLENLRGLEEWLEVVCPSPFVKVFPCLEVLELLCLSKLSMVPSHFPAIKNLRIVGIDDAAMLQKMSSKLTTLTSLDMLSVKGSELQLLVEELLGKNNLVALERFSVVNCLNLTSISDEIGGVTSLKEFKLRDCGKLTCLPKGLESLVSLEDIKIENLEELTWFAGGLQRLSSLVHLAVVDCPKLKAFPGIHGLTSLKTLLISGCKTLTSLPSGLQDCTFLQILHIIEYPALVSTMDLRCLTSLRRLGIGGYSEELNYFPWPYPSTSRGASMLECVSSLESLYLTGWPMLKSLPVQLEQLYALKELYLWHFDGLEALPEWLSNVSSLRINSSDSDCDRKKTLSFYTGNRGYWRASKGGYELSSGLSKEQQKWQVDALNKKGQREQALARTNKEKSERVLILVKLSSQSSDFSTES